MDVPSSPNLESVKLDPQARRHLFLLLKEAVTNVARHASARSVSLAFKLTNREFRAELRDDGRGFDPAPARARRPIGSPRPRQHARASRAARRPADDRVIPGDRNDCLVHMPLVRPWKRMTMLLPRRLR